MAHRPWDEQQDKIITGQQATKGETISSKTLHSLHV